MRSSEESRGAPEPVEKGEAHKVRKEGRQSDAHVSGTGTDHGMNKALDLHGDTPPTQEALSRSYASRAEKFGGHGKNRNRKI